MCHGAAIGVEFEVMELEIYTAFTKAGIPDEAARAAVDSIRKEIDNRYALHSAQLATRGDVEAVRKEVGELRGEMKAEIAKMQTEIAKSQAEIIKWCMGSIFAAVGLFLALSKMLH
jgi:hypothetical protein